MAQAPDEDHVDDAEPFPVVAEAQNVDGARGVQAVDGVVTDFDHRPTDGTGVATPLRELMLGRVDTEVCGLDPQRGIVREHQRRTLHGLTEGCADDPIVGNRCIESVFDQQMLLDPIDLDLEGAVTDGDRLGERAAVLDS